MDGVFTLSKNSMRELVYELNIENIWTEEDKTHYELEW
jgi:hypothetical protein